MRWKFDKDDVAYTAERLVAAIIGIAIWVGILLIKLFLAKWVLGL